MAQSILIIGASGTGKSTSLRNLDPKSTFIINVLGKPLPFRGFFKQYTLASKENPKGNYFVTDNYLEMIKVIERVNTNRPDIKTLIVDDVQYVLLNSYMRKCKEPLKPKESGFQKYSDLATEYWLLMTALTSCRNDLLTIALSHNEVDMQGKSIIKSVGKLLSEKISIEGMFTTVLQTALVEGKYLFQTQGDEGTIAKSPMDMFENKYIENDLSYVINKVKEYNDVYDEASSPESSEIKET